MVWVAPVLDRRAEVHERSFLHPAGDLGDERVVLALGRIECLVNILPGWPGHAVRPAEAVGRHAKVVYEARDANGASAIALLFDREAHGHGISCWHPALWAGRPAVTVMPCLL